MIEQLITQIEGRFGERRWSLHTPAGGAEVWRDEGPRGGHGGGDERALTDFLAACGQPEADAWTRWDEDQALAGVNFAFAAERARLSGQTVSLGAAQSSSDP